MTAPHRHQHHHQQHHHHRRRRATSGIALLGVGLLVTAACSTIGQQTPATGDAEGSALTVVTHDSFALSDELLAEFEESTGHEITWVAPGDGGALVNQLVLTKDAPLGDVVFGVDNTFAARAVAEDVFVPYTSPAADDLPAPFGDALTPVDFGDVCINIDHEWFAEQDLTEPVTLADLTEPAYADQLVVTNPATSSPGLAFLLATISAFGDDWQDYWRDLVDNGLEVADGWSDAYYVDFSGSEGEGPRPLALSYSSSPAAEAAGAEDAPTGALLETCFRQTEFAGVLAGAENPDGAQAFVDFLLSPEVQADIPGTMYVYPVRDDVELPADWARHAPAAEEPHELAPEEIAEERDAWLEQWTELVTG